MMPDDGAVELSHASRSSYHEFLRKGG